jgi:hypothetical protein
VANSPRDLFVWQRSMSDENLWHAPNDSDLRIRVGGLAVSVLRYIPEGIGGSAVRGFRVPLKMSTDRRLSLKRWLKSRSVFIS